MNILDKIFTRGHGPSERQLRRAVKQVTQIHGDPATRVSALERLGNWGTPGAASALLRRFTVQTVQGSMDLEEKQYTVRLLAGIGRAAVEPILHFLRTEPDVTWPAQALREIVPPDEYQRLLLETLEHLASSYARWPEAKAVLVGLVPDEAYAGLRDVLLKFLDDEDDGTAIAAIDQLARHGGEEERGRLMELFIKADARPRVRGRILEHFCDREWPVKGYRKKVEETIAEPFYLTSKGTVKRRAAV